MEAMVAAPARNAAGPESRARGDARRQQVLDAAAATFSRLGYHGASTRAIADALGIKVASLYFHFASKEEALEQICTLGMLRTIGYLDRAMAEADDLRGRLRRFFERQRDDLLAHADYVSVAIFEGRHLGPEARRRVAAHAGQLRGRIDAMFAEAAGRGELHAEVAPREARFIMIGTLRSISELYVSGDIRHFERVRGRWVEAAIRGLAAA
ncbi:MAG TPA: TetR/AcrR family transcriptional regulator [Novosphingobium sp.]